MSASYMLRVIPVSRHSTRSDKITSVNAFFDRPVTGVSLNASSTNEILIEKVRERLRNGKVEISPSAYDTAWVAMVPSGEYSGIKKPSFPQCLDWILKNQNPDGSWGLIPDHPYLVKDSLSCTLACVLALYKWDIGHQQVQKGLDFIAANGWASSRVDQFSPIGFNIVFPEMVNYAKELDLTLPLSPSLVDSLLHTRNSEIIRNQNLEYVAEGLGNSCNWKEIIRTHQRSNGSLFNSPATTAASLIHSYDDKCFEYLTSILKACNGWVPTIYPMDIYARLYTVDTLARLGIDWYFGCELSCILDEVYRCWQEKEEELISDITCRAMSFRLLRTKGYDVSSDELEEFVDQEHFFSQVSLQHKGVTTVLELYRASQFIIHEKDDILEKINVWTSAFLKQQLLNQTIVDKRLQKQVECELKNFNGVLDRVEHRRNIELYDSQDFQTLKTTYRSPSIHNEDFLRLSAQDFKFSQAQYRKELHQIERWHDECRFDELNQERNVVRISYDLAAATFVEPESSEARITFTQIFVLFTYVDDFFDLYGPREEALSIIELVRNWKMQTTYCSREVEILFTAIYNTMNETAAKAFAVQGRCVKHEIIDQCLGLVVAFAKSMDSRSDNGVSTLNDYFSYALKSIAFEFCLVVPMYFIGIKVPEGMIRCEEFTSLCYHASVVCRLLNDRNSFEREKDNERPVNSVSLLTVEGAIPEEEAILKVKQICEYHRRKVLQMVYQRKGSVIPQKYKDIFWKTCQGGYFLYPFDGGDEYSDPREIAKDMNVSLWDPLELPFLD